MSFLRRLLRLRRLPRDLFTALNDIRAEITQTRRDVADVLTLLAELNAMVQQIDLDTRARTAEIDRRFENVTMFLIRERYDRTVLARTLDQLRSDIATLDDKMRRCREVADQDRDVLERGILSVLTADVGRAVGSRA